MNAMGKNLKKFREDAGLSQQELAKRLSVTRQTISNWERGVSQPDLDSLMLLAEEFHVDVEEIIYGEKAISKFELTKKHRIKRTVIIGTCFLISLLLSIILIPYFRTFFRMFIVLPYSVAHFTLPAITYGIGAALILSLLSIWVDFEIPQKKIRLSLLIPSLSFIVLYFFFMFFSVFGQFAGIYLDDIIHSHSVYDWLVFHPVIFIFPGAMLFCGFNKNPEPSQSDSQPVQEVDAV